ncbi:MAG TPA: biotin/lipoyl-binding protein, partial [Acidobacteriaceae bacterium]|nr:biotin/lipoyl-binding protein [Acidobacteriaceae bacterium]
MKSAQRYTWKLPAVAASLLLLSFCLQACKKSSGEGTQTLVAVQAQHPEIGEISEHIMADATFWPLAQAAISPKITAPVKRFYVQRGSKVKAGQLLAVLENRDLTAMALDNKGQY